MTQDDDSLRDSLNIPKKDAIAPTAVPSDASAQGGGAATTSTLQTAVPPGGAPPATPPPTHGGPADVPWYKRPFDVHSLVALVLAVVGCTLFTTLLCRGKLDAAKFLWSLALLTSACLYLVGPQKWLLFRREIPSDPGMVPRTIAFTLLTLFGSALGLAGLIAGFTDDAEKAKSWAETFKSGFLLLGGGVTTIVGYYFGSRETTRAVEAARQSQEGVAGTAAAMGPVQGFGQRNTSAPVQQGQPAEQSTVASQQTEPAGPVPRRPPESTPEI